MIYTVYRGTCFNLQLPGVIISDVNEWRCSGWGLRLAAVGGVSSFLSGVSLSVVLKWHLIQVSSWT